MSPEARPLAVVTGTSRGLGRAIAAALLSRGWRVIGIARGAAPAELLGPNYAHERIDLADLERLEATFEGPFLERQDLSTPGALALVHNAGVVEPIGPVESLALDAVERAFALNVIAPLWLSGFVLRRSNARDVRIAEISSGAASSPYAGWAAYSSSKSALRMLGRVIALESAETATRAGRKVSVLSYAPHVVDTDMQAALRATSDERFPARGRFVALHERGELVAPEEPARELAETLGRDDLPPWSEMRFRP